MKFIEKNFGFWRSPAAYGLMNDRRQDFELLQRYAREGEQVRLGVWHNLAIVADFATQTSRF